MHAGYNGPEYAEEVSQQATRQDRSSVYSSNAQAVRSVPGDKEYRSGEEDASFL